MLRQVAIGWHRLLLPNAWAKHLRTQVGQEDSVAPWVVVRPDDLTDADRVTAHDVSPSPTRSAILSAGRTIRIDAGHFIAEAITNDALRTKRRGRTSGLHDRDW